MENKTINFDEYSDIFSVNIDKLVLYDVKNREIKDVVIPKGIRIIGACAFEECSNLESVDMPNSIRTIGESSFSKCYGLKSIIIPNGVKNIGRGAFSDCSNLASITIPKSVKKIGEFAFDYCNELKNIFYNGTIEDWCKIKLDDWSPMVNHSNFYVLDNAGDVENNGKKYRLLTQLKLPNTLTSIGKYQFSGFSLKIIEIPKSIKDIGEDAFSYFSDLESVFYDGTIEDWCSISFNSYDSNPMTFASKLYVLDNSGDIEYNGNKYKLLTELNIPSTITSIGTNQFSGFGLKDIEISASIKSVGVGSFSGCSNLEYAVIPNSVMWIEDYAFSGCSNLKSIVIAENVEFIGGEAFSGCDNLEKVYYAGTSSQWNSIRIEDNNELLTDASIYYYSEIKPTKEGNYWHYVNGKVVEW